MSEIQNKIRKWETAIEDIIIDINNLTDSTGVKHRIDTDCFLASANELFKRVKETVNRKSGSYILEVPEYINKSEGL